MVVDGVTLSEPAATCKLPVTATLPEVTLKEPLAIVTPDLVMVVACAVNAPAEEIYTTQTAATHRKTEQPAITHGLHTWNGKLASTPIVSALAAADLMEIRFPV